MSDKHGFIMDIIVPPNHSLIFTYLHSFISKIPDSIDSVHTAAYPAPGSVRLACLPDDRATEKMDHPILLVSQPSFIVADSVT